MLFECQTDFRIKVALGDVPQVDPFDLDAKIRLQR
jgi:hypothetical protein